MKPKLQLSLTLLMIAFVAFPPCQAECVDNENDGDVKKFIKKLGCNIQEGAGKIAEKSKPYVDSIRNETAKLADKAKPYVDSIGNEASKLADSAKQLGSDAANKFYEWRGKVHAANNETETVTDNFVFPTEEKTEKEEEKGSTPSSVDDRFLLDGGEHCQEGFRYVDSIKRCRKEITG